MTPVGKAIKSQPSSNTTDINNNTSTTVSLGKMDSLFIDLLNSTNRDHTYSITAPPKRRHCSAYSQEFH